MRNRSVLAVVTFAVSALVLAPAPAEAAGFGTWLRPVAGRVVRPFHAPVSRYGAGHLGVDLFAVPGTPVRAAATGTVVFAGPVGSSRHVVVRHAGGLRTSYSFLASIRVRAGEVVRRGAVVGTAGGRGERHETGVLHFGLRVGDVFVDPMRLFAPVDLPARVHLAPVSGSRPRDRTAVPICDHLVALRVDRPDGSP
jgi:murein DD-endopeptidase MepM/ murein hydrolase activator NlpD